MSENHRIFISYARGDGRELAQRLKRDLDAAGHGAWLDTDEIEGGASWSSTIEEAIDRCQVLLALLSDGSYRSHICRAEQLRALRKGKRVIPLLVQREAERPLHLEHLNYRDFATGTYDAALAALLSDITSAPAPPLPEKVRRTLVTAPPLPINYVPRPDELEALRRAVLREDDERGVALIALRGMGGVGKSVLAQALCHDPLVQAAFPDGVIWVTIGREPGSLASQIALVRGMLGDRSEAYEAPELAAARLRRVLEEKAALVVLDDVWEAAHVAAFRFEQRRSRLLFTTRNGTIALQFGAQEVRLGTLTRGQARALLREWAGRDDPSLEGIADRLGYLPLALRLAGARLREGMSGADWLKTFRRVSQIRLGRRPTDPHDSLQLSLELSLSLLAEADRRLYDALGAFPEDTPIPQAAAIRLWRGLDPSLGDFEAGELIAELARLELLQLDAGQALVLHDLLRDYARERLADGLPGVHEALLAAYNDDGRPWDTIADDGYLYRHLAYHLLGAVRAPELRRLLLTFDWLQAKLEATDVGALLADFELLMSDAEARGGEEAEIRPLRLVHEAIRQSAHVLGRYRWQLPGQLTGRLLGVQEPGFAALLAGALAWRGAPWLRPLTPSLIGVGGPLVRTLDMDADLPQALAVTPDGRRLVAGMFVGEIAIWDLQSGALLRTLEGHASAVCAVAVTPDGARLVSGSGHVLHGERSVNTIKVWDLAEGTELLTLPGHGGPITAVAVTPDGRTALSASNDGTVRVWDLDAGACTRTLAGHDDKVFGLAVTPDGRWALSAGADKMVWIWDLRGEAAPRQLRGHTSYVNAVVVTPDGRLAVTGSDDKTIRVWDLERLAQLHVLKGHTWSVRALTMLPGGRRVASASSDRSVRVWDVEEGVELFSLPGHANHVEALAAAPSSRLLASGASDGIKIWDLERGATWRDDQPHAGEVHRVAISPDGARAVTGSSDGTLVLWQLADGTRGPSLRRHTGIVTGLCALPDGRRTLSASVDGSLVLWNLEDGTATTLLGDELLKLQYTALAVSPDGSRAAAGSVSGHLELWDLGRLTLARRVSGHAESTRRIVFTPDGRRVITGTRDGTIEIWDAERGESLGQRREHGTIVHGLALLPGGKRLLSASGDATLKLWDLKRRGRPSTFYGHADGITDLALTADGAYAISASYDYTVRIWDTAARKLVETLTHHQDWVNAVSAAAVGRRFASASRDQTVVVWDLDRQAGALFAGENFLASCAISPDGRTVVAGDEEGYVHILRVEGLDAE